MELWAMEYPPLAPRQERRLNALLPEGVRPAGTESLCAWALLGMALLERLDRTALLRVEREKQGKPFFPDAPEICFSLSHTRGAVLVALSDRPVGADIEQLRTAPPHLARRYGLEGEEFFQSWVRREARGKRTGRGVTQELRAETPMAEGERFAFVETFPGYVAGVSAAEEIPERVRYCSLEMLLAAAERLI